MITQFAALRARTCSYLLDDGDENQKTKDEKKLVMKSRLTFKFEEYENINKIMKLY